MHTVEAIQKFPGSFPDFRRTSPDFGSQHPSPNVKNFLRFEAQIRLESITSRDAKSTCFKGSRTSCDVIILGRTPKGAYSSRGRSRHLLETAFSEPLLRSLFRTLFTVKTHSRAPSQNPSENPLPRTFSEPFLEHCVVV